MNTPELDRLAEEEQSDRFDHGVWDELIAAWLDSPEQSRDTHGHPVEPYTSDFESVTVSDILMHCIRKPVDKWTQADKNQVARALRAMKWEQFRKKRGGRVERRYQRRAKMPGGMIGDR
jgi:hypothetical protein